MYIAMGFASWFEPVVCLVVLVLISCCLKSRFYVVYRNIILRYVNRSKSFIQKES